jgi:hypothetical protein
MNDKVVIEEANENRVSSLKSKALQTEAENISRLFARNEDSQALRELGRVLEIIVAYIQNLPQTKQIVLQGLMGQALTAMENKDYVRLSDLLEYGIMPIIID